MHSGGILSYYLNFARKTLFESTWFTFLHLPIVALLYPDISNFYHKKVFQEVFMILAVRISL